MFDTTLIQTCKLYQILVEKIEISLMAAFLHDGTLKGEKAQKIMNFLQEMGISATSSQSHGVALDSLQKETKGKSVTEITKLKEAIKKLESEKEAGLTQFYKLLKKASELESRVISAEDESRVVKTEACRNEVKMIHERFSFEIEKSVLIDFIEGIVFKADQLLVKNFVLENQKESMNSQVKELRELIEELKLELGKTLDDNEALVLENSVLVWLFKESKIEAEEEAMEERTALLENFNYKSLKVLASETEYQNLNAEFSVLQESYNNLQTQMAKVVEENTVLKKDFMELKQQNHTLMHQSESQLHEATQTHENSIEVLNYRKEYLPNDAQIYPEAMDIHLLKETKLDRIITVEKTVDYMKRFTDDVETEIKHNKPKTLAEEFRYQCSYTVDDHRRICKLQHSTPAPKTHFDLKISAPKLGLKKSSSKASSVNSDTKFDDDFEMEHGREKKHKNRISDFGKKFLPKKYLHKSSEVMQQESKK